MSPEPEPRPGPFPQRVAWRGWTSVGGLAMAAVLVAAVLSGSRYFIGAALVASGVLGVAWALSRDDDELRERLRYTRGPGWWLGWLMSKTPGAGVKAVVLLLSAGIVALGVAALVTA